MKSRSALILGGGNANKWNGSSFTWSDDGIIIIQLAVFTTDQTTMAVRSYDGVIRKIASITRSCVMTLIDVFYVILMKFCLVYSKYGWQVRRCSVIEYPLSQKKVIILIVLN